jgi:hypothetical protein
LIRDGGNVEAACKTRTHPARYAVRVDAGCPLRESSPCCSSARSRPDQTADPNHWFKGSGNESFPSGEVTVSSAIVTPIVLEYRHDHPIVYALELLPAYDAIARVKVHGHW